MQLTRRDTKAVDILIKLSRQFEDWLAEAVGAANMQRLRGLLGQVLAALEQREKKGKEAVNS